MELVQYLLTFFFFFIIIILSFKNMHFKQRIRILWELRDRDKKQCWYIRKSWRYHLNQALIFTYIG